jgi:hypothetical protein
MNLLKKYSFTSFGMAEFRLRISIGEET